jgi:hypothetical protein
VGQTRQKISELVRRILPGPKAEPKQAATRRIIVRGRKLSDLERAELWTWAATYGIKNAGATRQEGIQEVV